MISWIKRLITNRYLKSVVRYGIAAAIGILSTQIDLPGMPAVQELLVFFQDALIEFLKVNQEQLAELLVGILSAWLGAWTVLKNRANAKVEKKVKEILPETRVK